MATDARPSLSYTVVQAEWEAMLKVEDRRERHRQLEVYLDKGRGNCHLRIPRIAGIVDAAFQYYHQRYYVLRAWVIMPNHVHLLFRVDATPLGKIIKQLKQYTARKANELLKQRGQFWAEDAWDTYMRDAAHELQTRRYIEGNPVKAGLVKTAQDWPWSSARFRDENGVLRL